MDNTDKMLIRRLSEGADVTASELEKYVNLSIPSINKRIGRLKSLGIIKKYSIVTNSSLVGKGLIAFVFMTVSSSAKLEDIKRFVSNNNDILECYSVTGPYDFVIKVAMKSINDLENTLSVLKKEFGVTKSQTMVTLTEHKFCPCAVPDLD